MTKLVSIAISLLILVQSFNVSIAEILEMDELMEHARFHAEEYGDNFMVFLSKHYGKLKAEHSKKHQEEKERHEDLPFNHQMHTVTLSVFVLTQGIIYTKNPVFSAESITNFFYQDTDSLFEKEGPFQPPRSA